MENPFKEKANRFLKNAKLAGLGLAIGASSLNEAEAQNVHGTFVDNSKNKTEVSKNEETRSPIIVHDKNDPRLKKYEDSLKVYNLTSGENFDNTWDMLRTKLWNEGFKENDSHMKEEETKYDFNESNPKTGVYGSKIEYSITKNPLYYNVVDLFKHDEGYIPGETYKLLNKYKPIGYKNKLEYSHDYISADFAISLGKNPIWLNPSTDSLEDNVDRKKLKEVFPELTDEEIDEEIEYHRKNPIYIKKGSMVKDTTVHSARLGTTFNNLDGSKYTLTENDCKQEDITEKIRRIVGSYPIYKNPVQPYVYEPKIRKYFDSNVWGWDGSTDVVGYYNKGNGKGRIDVTINEIKGMTEEEFEEMFPDAAKNVRKTIIEQYDARKKIDNLFVSKDNK